MNESAILAFVVTPALVVGLGYVAVRLHERSLLRSGHESSATSSR